MSKNPETIGVLGGMKPFPMTSFDKMLNMKYNPVYRKYGPPKENTYEAFGPDGGYNPRTQFDIALQKKFCSSCKGGYWPGSNPDPQGYAEAEHYQPSPQGYANIMDDPYNPYSSYAHYIPMSTCKK